MTGTHTTSATHETESRPVPLVALSAAFLILLLDCGTSPATLLCSVAILLLACVWVMRQTKATWPGLLLSTLLLLGLITVAPLPDSILRIAGTEAASHHDTARTALTASHDAGITPSPPGYFQISRNGAGTIRALLLLSLALASALLARHLSASQRHTFLLSLGMIAAAIGVTGMVAIHFIPQGKTFWWTLPVLHGKPVACFMNRNHFGGLLAVMASLMLGLTCSSWSERRPTSTALAATAFLFCAISVVGSFSRGALLSLACGILAGIILNARKQPAIVAGLVVLLAAASLTALSVGSSGGSLQSRLATIASPLETTSARLRIETWKESAPILNSYPIFGTGLNGFRAVFPQHRSSTSRKEAKNVENEYIQLPVELGLLGSILLLAAIILFARPFFRRDKLRSATTRLLLPAFVVVLAHCAMDFAIRIPLYALSIAILVGFAMSKEHEIGSAKLRTTASLLFLPISFILLGMAAISPTSVFKLDSPDYLISATPRSVAKAIESSPSYWHAYYNLGRTAATRPGLRTLAESHIATASDLNPHNYRLLIELARLRVDMGQEEKAIDAYRRAKALRSWLHIPNLEKHLTQE